MIVVRIGRALVTLALLAGLLAGCEAPPPHYGLPSNATPGETAEARRLLGLALDDWIRQSARVQRISQRVRLAGRALCGDELSVVLGASLIDLRQIPPELMPIVEERYGARLGLRVTEVFPDLPAAAAGLRVGDTLVAVGKWRARRLRDIARVYVDDGPAIEVQVERGGKDLALMMPRELGCEFYARYHQSVVDQVQAETDTRQVWMYAGMLREFRDDETVALVIGHEFGHAILRHVLRKRAGGQQAEIRSDYLGAYLAARAGMRSDPERLFRALRRNFNDLDKTSRTHPMTHERTLAARRADAEIARKLAGGEELIPEALP